MTAGAIRVKTCKAPIKMSPPTNLYRPGANHRVTTHLENLEKSGNWIVVREKSGKMEKVREVIITILELHERKILPHF